VAEEIVINLPFKAEDRKKKNNILQTIFKAKMVKTAYKVFLIVFKQ